MRIIIYSWLFLPCLRSFWSGACPRHCRTSKNHQTWQKYWKKYLLRLCSTHFSSWFRVPRTQVLGIHNNHHYARRQGLGELPCFFWQGEELDYYHFTLRIIVLCQAKRKGVYLDDAKNSWEELCDRIYFSNTAAWPMIYDSFKVIVVVCSSYIYY